MSLDQSGGTKQTLKRALRLAQEAVGFDMAKNHQAACTSYCQSIALLADVMHALESSVDKQEGDVPHHQSELKRITDIRKAYVERVNILSKKYEIPHRSFV